ncbi:gamma-glutamyl-gamma-aminobutyrate hydrolase family protein [Brackiella oedipodis]|uniref:gamma-glutamyl-gamma-aminobutyrate hydrolase family protein n=1 Tax=Brackiella oedipodis TaxID=124225 RepID=UPI00048A90EA|nr:gamma-glutamyl-gamma-aminobutyrate hydrolase family protein [Brackiella oedipodis]
MSVSESHTIIGISGCSTDSDDHYSQVSNTIEAVERAGGIPLILPPINPGFVPAWIDVIDGLIIGHRIDVDPSTYQGQYQPDLHNSNPTQDTVEIKLILACIEQQVPLLCISRGLHLLNLALGGDLRICEAYGKPQTQAKAATASNGTLPLQSIKIKKDSILYSIFGHHHLQVNSSHHLALDGLGRCLNATARSAGGMIEAVELFSHPEVLAVQWQADLMARQDQRQQNLFDWLVQKASQRRLTKAPRKSA